MEIANLFVKIGADISGMVKGLDTASGKIQSFGKNMSKIGGPLNKYITLPLGGVGLVGLKTAADFEQAMSNVRAITGGTKKDVESLGVTAVEMAKRYSGSAKDAADALYYIASAGYDAKESQSALQGVMALASATQSDLAYTSEAAMSAISMFGLEASSTSRIADVYARTISLSQATMEKMADSMRYVGPLARQLGWDIEQTSAALGLLYNAGFKGEQAGTILRGALSSLLKPSDEANQALKRLKITQEELAEAMKSPIALIKLFEDAGLSATDAITIFGRESGPGMMNLLQQGSGALKDFTGDLYGAGGAADKVARDQMDNLNGKLEKVRDSFNGIAISLSKSEGALDALSRVFDSIANALNNMSPEQQKALLYFGMFLAAIGPIVSVTGKLITFFGWLAKIIAPVIAYFAEAGGVVAGLKAIFATIVGAITSPAAVIIAIVAAIAGAVYLIWRNWDWIKQKAIEIWGGIKNFLLVTIPEIYNSIVDWFAKLPGKIDTFLSELPSKVAHWFGYMLGAIVGWLIQLPEKVSKSFNDLKTAATNITMKAVDSVVAFFGGLPGRVVVFFGNLKNNIISRFNEIKSSMIIIGREACDSASNFFKELPHKIFSYLAGLPGALLVKAKQIASSFWDGFKKGLGINSPSYVEQAFFAMKAAATAAIQGIKGQVPKIESLMGALGLSSPKSLGEATISANVPATSSAQTIIVELDGNQIGRVVSKKMFSNLRVQTVFE